MNKRNIRIESGEVRIELEVEFLDTLASKTILKALPIESKAKTWGDEIYFDTGIAAPAEAATLEVEVGDIAYWPDGRALCIFFGPTPVSTKGKPVPASEVVIVGNCSLDPALMRRVRSGARITVG